MIRVGVHRDEGFRVMVESGEWKIGLLRYSERFSRLSEMERHMLTDEVFVLLSGKASLVIGKEQRETPLEIGKIYNVKKGVFHAMLMERDAKVLIVENHNTARDNTDYYYFK